MNTNKLQISKLVDKFLTLKKPERLPINSIDMNYKAHFGKLNCWEIRQKHKGYLIAISIEGFMYPSFLIPDEWDTSKTYNIELEITDGCSNTQCDWSCNGCTSKVKIVDSTNNLVTILRYN